LTRIGVGNHLILGGDNMDLALAHLVESRMAAQDGQDAARRACRPPPGPADGTLPRRQGTAAGARRAGAGERHPAGRRFAPDRRQPQGPAAPRGHRSASCSTASSRSTRRKEGAKRARAGIVEFGLPYASDPAITRHLASFLRQHARRRARRSACRRTTAALPVPDTLLLNGGVFRGAALAERLAATLSRWRGAPLRVLHNLDPDVAVARGGSPTRWRARAWRPPSKAARRAATTCCSTRRARAAQPCAPSACSRAASRRRRSAPAERSFALRLGRPVRFHLVSTVADPRARRRSPATWSISIRPTSCACRHRHRAARAGGAAPRRDAGAAGGLAVRSRHARSALRGRRRQRPALAARIPAARSGSERAGTTRPAVLPPQPRRRHQRIDRIFGTRSSRSPAAKCASCAPASNTCWARANAGPRRCCGACSTPDGARQGPAQVAEHERAWLNLAGFCLRPGFGHPLDGWRIEQLWAMFDTGVQYHKDSQVRAEWWTLWRRVAGGLSTEAQLRLLDDFAFNLQADASERGKRPITLVDGSEDDMLRLGASLERIPSAYKARSATG
jgi:hypothetical protein